MVLAGALGALARHEVSLALARRSRRPWGTLVVNVLGAVAAGATVGLDPGLGLVLGTGFLGGFTTFSTWAVDTLRLVEEEGRWVAIANVAVMLAAGLAAAALGRSL
jgi:CrcB protein